MPNIEVNISANAVAWYGAIVASVSVLLATFSYIGDKRKIKVRVSHGLFMGHSLSLDEKMTVFLNAANTGKRPVTISSAGFRFKDGQDIVLTETPNLRLPFTIEEGRSCQTWIEKSSLLKAMKHEKSRIKFGWYRDSTGKLYKGKYRINDTV